MFSFLFIINFFSLSFSISFSSLLPLKILRFGGILNSLFNWFNNSSSLPKWSLNILSAYLLIDGEYSSRIFRINFLISCFLDILLRNDFLGVCGPCAYFLYGTDEFNIPDPSKVGTVLQLSIIWSDKYGLDCIWWFLKIGISEMLICSILTFSCAIAIDSFPIKSVFISDCFSLLFLIKRIVGLI